MNNPYLPARAEILDIIQETSSEQDVKTFRLKLDDSAAMEFLPGQFLELSVPGAGEAPFGFASSPLIRDTIELTVKKMGLLTQALHNCCPGSPVGLRGPFGNAFPLEEMEGANLLFVAGGLGLAPLRPLIGSVMDSARRSRFGGIKMLLAARTPGDFIFRRDYEAWGSQAELLCTIDRPEPGWTGRVGFPNDLVGEMDIDCQGTYALLCGPPIMIKLVSARLAQVGLPLERIITTLENRMTCGVGKCGKCNVGRRYVCVDGPVFRMSQLSQMPDEY